MVLGDNLLCAYYCKYIEGNLKDKFGRKESLLALFWKVARARLPSGFEHHMQKIAAINAAAKEYLQAIDLVLWAVAHFPRTRYSHLT